MKGRPHHGMRQTRTYKQWDSMKCRTKLDSPSYSHVTHCDRWATFEEFYEDMGDCPDGHGLDRIDNSKGYSPDNCRWATSKQQARNRTNNRWLTFQGKTQLACDWAEELGIKLRTLETRLNRGWSVEDALGRVVQLKS